MALAGCVEYGELNVEEPPCPEQPGPAGIWGLVRNRHDEPIPRAYVTAVDKDASGGYGGAIITVSTKVDGHFYFCQADFEQYRLEFSKDGYKPVVRTYAREEHSMFHPVTLEPA